ncbi:hypothetical protein FKM82_030511, partial [Ascaphus truei]
MAKGFVPAVGLLVILGRSLPRSEKVRGNRRSRVRGCLFGLVGFLLPLFLFASALFGSTSPELWNALLGEAAAEALGMYLSPLSTLWSLLPADCLGYVFLALLVLSALLLLLARSCFRYL